MMKNYIIIESDEDIEEIKNPSVEICPEALASDERGDIEVQIFHQKQSGELIQAFQQKIQLQPVDKKRKKKSSKTVHKQKIRLMTLIPAKNNSFLKTQNHQEQCDYIPSSSDQQSLSQIMLQKSKAKFNDLKKQDKNIETSMTIFKNKVSMIINVQAGQVFLIDENNFILLANIFNFNLQRGLNTIKLQPQAFYNFLLNVINTFDD